MDGDGYIWMHKSPPTNVGGSSPDGSKCRGCNSQRRELQDLMRDKGDGLLHRIHYHPKIIGWWCPNCGVTLLPQEIG